MIILAEGPLVNLGCATPAGLQLGELSVKLTQKHADYVGSPIEVPYKTDLIGISSDGAALRKE